MQVTTNIPINENELYQRGFEDALKSIHNDIVDLYEMVEKLGKLVRDLIDEK